MDPPFVCAFFPTVSTPKQKRVVNFPPNPPSISPDTCVICEGGQAEMSSAATVSAGPDGVVSGVSKFHFLPLGVTTQPGFW